MSGDDVTLPGARPAVAALLDDVSRAFEQLWTTDKRARIEDFLPRVPRELRPRLLERLMRLEFELQSRSGETFAVRDYREQFAEYRDVVESVLAELSTKHHGVDPTLQSHVSTLGREAALDENTEPLQPAMRGPRATRPLLPTNRFGDYEIIDEIARGGMGVVYKARQLKLNRVVAVKMILAGQFASQDEVQRFYSEAEAAAKLDHPGIVPIYEVDEFEGRHYFSMGFVDGESLQQRVAKGPLPQREAADLLRQVAEAVQYAHQHGVIHRDLKPRNILLTADGHPKVTDFGLAKSIEGDGGLTVSGQILGTPGYMPPEQAGGKLDEIGPRADVYGLGALLYCLLTGRPPFQSASAVETIRQVMEMQPPSPRLLNPAINRDLETICLKCLEKDPSHRYATAAELAAELQRYLSGEPIRARRIGPVGRSWRWLRRKPLVAALGGTLLLLAVVIAISANVAIRSFEGRRVAALQRSIETNLDSPQLTEDYLTTTDALLAQLGQRNPEMAAEDRIRLNQAFAQRIGKELSRARLDAEAIATVQNALVLLKPRDERLARPLLAELERRQRDWQTLFHMADPFDKANEVFTNGEYTVESKRLTVSVPAPRETRKVLTCIASDGLVQLEVKFDGGWEQASRIGLSLKAEKIKGYDFYVLADDARNVRDEGAVAADAPSKLTFQSLRDRDAYFTLAIYRNGLLMLREQVHHAQVPSGPLVLRATCEQAQLRLQINALPAVSFRDPFPIPARQAGVFGVEWPKDVGLFELEARRKPKPAAESPLEKGDELFEGGRYELALEQYGQQAIQADDVEFRQESRYKQGLCLMQVGRLEDAAVLFDGVMNGDGERWPPIAGCQLWVIRLRQKRHTEADSVFDYLSTRFRFDQVASLIPQELRQEILDSYHSDLESISTVIRFNPDLVLDMRRLAAVDRFLSADGRGRELMQMEVSRGYHLLGDLPSALHAAESVARGSRNATVVRHYLRLLRLNGDPETALEELNKFERQGIDGSEAKQIHLLLERARIYAALNRWPECEQTLDEFLQHHRQAKLPDPATFTYYAMMKGMLLDRRGETGAAQAVWRQGYEGMRENLQKVKGPNSEVVNAVILGSLCGDLSDEECRQFFTGVVNRGGDNAIARQAQTIIGPQYIAAGLRQMWRSPLGRKYAEDFAFERISLRDRVKVPAVLLATEFFNQAVFDQEMTDEQRQAGFDTLAIGYDQAIYEGKFTISHVAQIILTWKGTANFLGWAGVAPSLHPELRGGMAYTFAHRYLKLGDPAQAAKFLDMAIQDAPANSPLAKYAAQDKDLLAAGKGRLLISSDLPEKVQVIISQGSAPATVVEVEKAQEIDVPAGDLQLALATPHDECRLSRASVHITPMGRRHVKLQWLGKPADQETPPGLIPQPSGSVATPSDSQPVIKPRPAVEVPSKEAETLVTRELAIIKDAAITESSGLAASSRADAVWTHNDDDKSPRLYLVSREGETISRFDLKDATAFDWEDMCAFRRGEVNYLLVGDIGDNRIARTDCKLHLFKEPDISQRSDEVVAVPLHVTIPFEYEDGPHDCEALAVDAERNVALLITKELDESCRMYEVSLEPPEDKPAVAKRLREIKLPLVTAMDISPDGRRLVVLGGLHAFEFTRGERESWLQAMDRPARRYVLPHARQAEAICYRADGKALLVTSEGLNTPLWEMILRDE